MPADLAFGFAGSDWAISVGDPTSAMQGSVTGKHVTFSPGDRVYALESPFPKWGRKRMDSGSDFLRITDAGTRGAKALIARARRPRASATQTAAQFRTNADPDRIRAPRGGFSLMVDDRLCYRYLPLQGYYTPEAGS